MPGLVVWASCVIVVVLALLVQLTQASILATLNNDAFLPTTFRSGGETGFGLFIIAVTVCGFVIIGNCFYLTAVNDIRYLGRLRAVGMTGRQGTRLLLTQAIILFLLALPAGVVLAVPLGNMLIPVVLSLLNTAPENHELAGLSELPPKSIALSVACILAAVVLASLYASFRANRISIVESMNYTGKTQRAKLRRAVQEAPGRNTHAMRRYATANAKRGFPRLVAPFAIIMTGFILLIVSNTLAAGMDSASFGQYALGGWDYHVEDMARYGKSIQDGNENDAGLTRGRIDEIRAIDGIATVAALETAPVMMRYEEAFEKDMVAFENGLAAYEEETGEYEDGSTAFEAMEGSTPKREEFIESNIICADEELMNIRAAGSGGEIDVSAYHSPGSYYLSALTPTNSNDVKSVGIMLRGEEKDFPVRGVIPSGLLKMEGTMPFLVTSPQNIDISGLDYYMMEDVYIKLRTGADESEVRSQLAALLGHNERIRVTSRADMERSMGGARELFHVIGGFVAGAILLMGLFGLISATMLMMNGRRFEIAVIRSVGASRRQLRNMLIREGLLYATVLTAIAVAAGSLINHGVFRAFSSEAEYAVFSYPTEAVAIIATTGFAVLLALPYAIFRLNDRAPVIEILKRSDN
jgi:putative ABC transport system permease protein